LYKRLRLGHFQAGSKGTVKPLRNVSRYTAHVTGGGIFMVIIEHRNDGRDSRGYRKHISRI
jgi:hypothetical protein